MISLTFPSETWAHAIPVGWKLACLSGATLALFSFGSIQVQATALILTILLYLSGGRLFARSGLKTLRILWPFLAVIFLWHMIDGTPREGFSIALRLSSTVALANFVTMTSRLSDMIDTAAWLLTPFRRLGLRTRSLEIAIALVIRFTPLLSLRGAQLVDAWRARSARRPSWRIALPLTVSALDDADHVAEALKARGGIH